MARACLALLLCLGCGKSASPPPASPDAAALAPRADAAVAVAEALGREKLNIPKETRLEYRKRLKAGRKAGEKRQWSDAVAELEAALAAVPGDPRALSELTWALFQSGDHARARQVGLDAVRLAPDANLRAAGLYNLGRVAEAAGDKDAAVRHYKESLGLRRNDAVEKRLAGLGKLPAKGWEPWMDVPCKDSPGTAGHVCECLSQHAAEMDGGAEVACRYAEEDLSLPEDVKIAAVTVREDTEYFMVLKDGARWKPIGSLGSFYAGGVAGVFGEWEISKVEEVRMGLARLLRVEIDYSFHDSDIGVDEVTMGGQKLLSVCVLSGRKEGAACPLQVPLEVTLERDVLGLAEDDEIDAETRKRQERELPWKKSARLDVKILPDGVAQVVLKEGTTGVSPEVKGALGPHKLW
jgi:tetratricopeptide (TPR) repeat protein